MLSNKDFKMFSVDHIAAQAGFNDRYNFYRVFKKITGLSPTEFRKNLIG
jgi:AraC-like DNA-binding protein